MAHSYTPGLRVSRSTTIVKERRLPLKGEVVVKTGDSVEAKQIVAKTDLPGNAHPVNCAGQLGVVPADIEEHLTVKVGDKIKKNETVAMSKSFFGLFKSRVNSPISGVLESASPITGQLILREPPIPVEISAYIDGVVKNIFPQEGVSVETIGTLIQGIFGIGGERYGKIKIAVNSADDILKADMISADHKDCIIVGGGRVELEAYHKATEVGAVAIVVGGMYNLNLKKFLGYEQGVAITGHEDLAVTLVLTEGFGNISMAHRTFDLLTEHDGRNASVSGATQIRAGVIRPEVIIPLEQSETGKREIKETGGLEIGHTLRVIRQPYFGKLGKVTALPTELRELETGAKVRVLELELAEGDKIVLPRANVEIIEE